MANDQPDSAAGDSAIIVRVHAFLAALLTFLGFSVAADESVSTALDKLFAWLDGASKIRRDPQGATARIWWDIFKAAMLESRGKREYAAQIADEAIDEFGRRFLPVADEDRDTLNTADFEAMRAELDQADRYRGEISDALDGNTGERQWLHARLIDELRAERDALLAANEHHASELHSERASHKMLWNQVIAFRVALFEAMDKKSDEGIDVIDTVAALRKERDALRAQLASAIVPLPKPERVETGQRWAIAMTATEQSAGEKWAAFTDGSGCGYTAFSEDLACSYYLGKDA